MGVERILIYYYLLFIIIYLKLLINYYFNVYYKCVVSGILRLKR